MLTHKILALVFLVSGTIVAKPAPPQVPHSPRCGLVHNNATCIGMCCSAAGYCGTTEEHCSVPGNCQEAYGWCDSFITPSGLEVIDRQPLLHPMATMINKCTVPKTLALTFDDGPTEYTGALLSVLAKYGARATFFVAGVNNGHGQLDIRWRDTVKHMITDGHQVGSHTWSHPNLDELSSDARKMEMYKTDRSIINIIGKMPTFMRPPMVICGDECMKDMQNISYHVVGWEVDSEDWQVPHPTVAETTRRLINEMHKPDRENMFLIQHDTSHETIEIVDNLLAMMPQGWSAVPLVECLGYPLQHAFQYPKYLEHNPTSGLPPACVASGPGFCMSNDPFVGSEACFRAVMQASAVSSQCTPRGAQHCETAISSFRQMHDFCKDCQNARDEDCNSKGLTYRVW